MRENLIITMPRQMHMVETLLEHEELRLLNALQQWPSLNCRPKVQHRNYTMCLLMLDSGLRVGEVVNLKIQQLLYCGEPVTAIDIPAEDSKSNCGRCVPVTSRLIIALGTMKTFYWSDFQISPGDYAFFSTSRCVPLTTRQVQRIIKEAARVSLGRDIHPHVLRHTFATKLMRKTSIRVVQQLLGHKCLTSTEVYTHPNSNDLREAIEELQAETNRLSPKT